MENLNTINKKLTALYESKIPNLKEYYSYDRNQHMTNPLLIKSTKDYISAKCRMMFVGQETFGWYEKANYDDIVSLQTEYERFVNSYYSSPFWDYIRAVCNDVNNNSNSFVWNNVIKIGKADEAGKPESEFLERETRLFNVLKDEIDIIRPDVIVFLTGPNYDQEIRNHCSNFTVVESFGKCFDKIIFSTSKVLAFRMYHPAYQRRAYLEKEYKEILVNEIKKAVNA